MGKEADELIALHQDYHSFFAVANFYEHWKDLSDEEVVSLLKKEKVLD